MIAAEGPRPRLLIVDDEDENIELMTRSFRVGFRVWVAHSAEEAREILLDRAVDVIITDHRLPGEHGTSLLDHVREHYPKTRRVLITAYADNPNVVSACNSGTVERFFLKPYAPSALAGAVLELLRRPDSEQSPVVLVADSDAAVLDRACEVLHARGLRTIRAANAPAAAVALTGEGLDAAVIASGLDGGDALGLLRIAQGRDPAIPVIVLTSDDLKVSLSLMEAGAFDFVSKPLREAELSMRVERALVSMQQARDHRKLLAEVTQAKYAERLVATSEVMQRTLALARNVARHDINVLINGETGTGKEVFAHIIHESSRRAAGPFIAVNCGALPEALVESALFGHERGAFTDARERRVGLFEAAEGGTLFLDEVGELSLSAQVRLLRVLETREFTRVGSNQSIRADVRVVAATHRDLQAMVREQRVREDLFFRLSAVSILLPPLRERPDDIPKLLESAVAAFASRNSIPVPLIRSTAIRQAVSYRWPGNVRELLHVVERTLIKMGSEALDELDIGASPTTAARPLLGQVDAKLPMREALEPLIADLERRYIVEALERNGGQLARTAEHAGIHRKSLYNKMRLYGLSAEQTKPDVS